MSGRERHHLSELVRLHDRLCRFLVRERGFTAFALESGLPEGLEVDRWVRGGRGTLADVADRGITWSFGRSHERHAQLTWMREQNLAHPRQVGFWGLDVPGGLTSPLPGVAACLARLEPRPGDGGLLAAADLGQSTRAPSPDASAAVPAELVEGIEELVARAEAAGDGVAVGCARGAARVVEFLERGLYPGPGRNLRNEVMAENLRRLLHQEQRIVVSAHNVHVQRTPSFDGTDSVGRLLGPELGQDLVVVGTTHAGPEVPAEPDLDADPAQRFARTVPAPLPADCLDAVLDQQGPLHLLDLRRHPAGLLDEVGTMRGQQHIIDIAPRSAFDAVIHVRNTNPTVGV